MPSGYRLTQKEVEKRIRDLHGDEIDLSKFIFVTQRTKSIFICNVNPEHGEWLAHPKELYRTDGKKTGCPKCAKDKFKPMTPWEDVSKKLKQIHGDEYEYYSENYNGVSKNIDVRCKHHNHIWNVRVMDLIKGQGCPKCGNEKSSKKRVIKVSEFIERSIKKHGDRYDYSKVHQFKRQKEKVTIICTKHGEFQQTAHDHQLGAGCSKCWEEIRSEVLTLPWEKVLKSFRETHDDTYDYLENTYVNSHETMEIICKRHGVFEQSVANHRIGYGCPKCGRERISEFLTTPWEEVLKSFRETHKDEYRYTPETYTLLETPMEMFCSKHGRFLQTPKVHRKGSGCPICKSSLGEKFIYHFLNEHKINFIQQHKFDDLVFKGHLRCDFYVEEFNLVIEYNGEQHYIPNEFFGGEVGFKLTVERDFLKKQYCLEKNINYEVVRYDEDKNKRMLEILRKYNKN